MDERFKIMLEKEARKHAERFHRYHNNLEIEHQRNIKRVSPPHLKTIKTPIYWDQNKLFNPFYVLKKLESISLSVGRKMEAGTYKPHTPYIHSIPKADGKIRSVSVFQIPDAAVSNMLYQSLMDKNKHRFSSLSYAYRSDRNVHYAIQDIANDFKKSSRMFIAEFDFTDFFGSISHDYIYRQLKDNGFLVSDFEEKIIKQFLSVSDKGVSQGTSVSLFLANLACWQLDRSLEKIGLRFARYADDTVIWTDDYSKICRAYEILDSFSQETGVKINPQKSSGISLMTKPGYPSELISTKKSIEFLGYELSQVNVGIKAKSVRKIKKQISYILYKNLIQPLNHTPLRAQIIPSNGRDSAYVTSIMQIRRYLYGGANEALLKRYLRGDLKRINFKGLMSFYPLVDDIEQLQHLDRWLISTILKTLNTRYELLMSKKLISSGYLNFPFNMNDKTIIPVCKAYRLGRRKGLVEIPSFLRIFNAIKKGLLTSGIEAVMSEDSETYSYNE